MGDTPVTPRQALIGSRIIWAALLLGQVIFLCVILFLRRSGGPDAPPPPVLAYVAMLAVVVAAPIAFVMRKAMYGPPDDRGNIPPKKYAAGNLRFLAILEGVSMLGLVIFLAGDPLGLASSGVAMAIQAVNFPMGTAMGIDTV